MKKLDSLQWENYFLWSRKRRVLRTNVSVPEQDVVFILNGEEIPLMLFNIIKAMGLKEHRFSIQRLRKNSSPEMFKSKILILFGKEVAEAYLGPTSGTWDQRCCQWFENMLPVWSIEEMQTSTDLKMQTWQALKSAMERIAEPYTFER